MRRKFLSVVLCVCMMLTMAPFAFAAGETASATTNPPSSSSGSGSGSVTPTAGITTEDALKEAISAASENETITLGGNITLTAPIIIEKKITLDMAGHTFSNAQDIWNDTTAAWSFISVQGNGDLTITGNGTFQTKANDCYAVDVRDGATLTIENGTLVGNIHAVYVHKGTAYIKGGTYSVQQKYPQTGKGDEFVLNLYDTNRSNGTAKMTVTGGTFANFNPANCQAEGANTNFCAEGYSTKQEDENYTVMGPVAAIGEHNYATLDAAVEAADNKTVTLLKDVTEDVVIPADKTVTLDLNGKKLTNVNNHTIINNGTLTITGTGTVDNVTHQKAALYNKGTVTVNGGTFDRSQENGKTKEDSGNNSWYTIKNVGTMTINDGAIVQTAANDSALGKFSSLVSNGYFNAADYTNNKGIDQPSLTINGGTFRGGLNTIKNDDRANLVIENGSFSNYYQAVVQNHNIAEIKGGTFTAASDATTATYGIYNCGCDAETDTGVLTVSGGTFTGATYAIVDVSSQSPAVNISGGQFAGTKAAIARSTSSNAQIFVTGGYFTSDPTTYLATGYVAGSSDLTGYNYKVTQKTDTGAVEVKPAVAAPTVNADAIKADDKTAVENAAKSISVSTLGVAATDKAQNIDKDTAEKAVESMPTGTKLYVQSTLKVTPTAYDSNKKEFALEITPQYRIVASTAANADAIDSTSDNKVIQDYTDMSITQPTEVTMQLPAGFAQENDKLSIKHIKNGTAEYYTGIVTKDSENNLYLTFTTNGFSPFVISAAAAFIGDTAYPTFQEAVENVKNNETITLAQNVATDTVVTVARTVKFSIDTSRSSFAFDKDKNIVAGSNTTVNVTGTASPYTYDFTYTRPSSGSPSSSGGSIAAPTTYAVNVNAATNGAVAADKKTASKGTTVTVTASPSKGYVVDGVKVVDKDGKDVAVTGKDGKYVFTMPGSAVTVTGTFKAETPVALPFTDVKSGDWFYPAVQYAYAQGLMTGTSATTFAPNGTMNRAMIVTVLYRLEKSPAVTGASKFTDVPAGQWYSDAVAWAAANKIVNGYDETTFGPMNAVTREQMAAILFRYEQVKGLENVTLEENLNRFPDQNKISAYAIPALQWAVGQKIINGNADGTLDPTGTATRAQVAQIFTNLLNQ